MKNNCTDASWNGRTARRRKRFPSACPLRRHGERLTRILMSTNNRWKHTLACMLCNGFGLQVERRLFKIDAVLRPSPAIRQVCTRLVTQMKSTLLEMSWKIKLRNLKHFTFKRVGQTCRSWLRLYTAKWLTWISWFFVEKGHHSSSTLLLSGSEEYTVQPRRGTARWLRSFSCRGRDGDQTRSEH